MSEQTEGPYHPAMNRLSVKFGPEHDQVKFSSPETVDTECALMNIAFNQSVSSQQARIEELNKETWSLGTERDELKVHIRELEAELEARKKAWKELKVYAELRSLLTELTQDEKQYQRGRNAVASEFKAKLTALEATLPKGGA